MGEHCSAAAAAAWIGEESSERVMEEEAAAGIIIAARLRITRRQGSGAHDAAISCSYLSLDVMRRWPNLSRSLISLQLMCILLLGLLLLPPAFCQTDSSRATNSVSEVAGSSYPKEPNTIGINYGRVADNLPTPQEAVSLIQSMKIGRVKLFDSDPTVLTALGNTGLQVISALPNEDIAAVAASNETAELWVQQNVLAYYPATHISAIHVGNELWGTPAFQPQWDQLMPCIWNIYASLTNHSLSQAIKISTAVAFNALGTSYPPSAGAFSDEIAVPYVQPLLQFLSTTHSYFYINVYPYFAWASDSGQIPLQYALFESPVASVLDTGLKYYDMLDAQLDAVNAAMTRLGYGDVRLAISETGWPTAGDPNQLGCNIPNAENYNRRLLNKMLSTSVVGTPARPGIFIPTFIFALFNEDLKPGAGTERHWGLLYPNGTNVYSIDMTGQMGNNNNPTGAGSGPATATTLPNNDPGAEPDSASPPFNDIPFDISSAVAAAGRSSSPSSPYSSTKRQSLHSNLLLQILLICINQLLKFPLLSITITMFFIILQS